MVKNLPAMQETSVPSLGWEDPLEKKNGYLLQYSYLENAIYREHLLFFHSTTGGPIKIYSVSYQHSYHVLQEVFSISSFFSPSSYGKCPSSSLLVHLYHRFHHILLKMTPFVLDYRHLKIRDPVICS